jgi:hypothetical protein
MNSNGLCFVFPIEIAMWGVYPTVSNRDGKKQLPPSKTDCSQPEPFRILGRGGA